MRAPCCMVWNMEGVTDRDNVTALICCKGTFVNLRNEDKKHNLI